MYAMWSSLGKEKDPFVIIPAFPIKDEFKDSWSKTRIRKEIFDAETGDIMQVIIKLIMMSRFKHKRSLSEL